MSNSKNNSSKRKIERQNKFATNKQKQDSPDTQPDTATKPSAKRGAPIGHSGWFRRTPTEYDWEVEVNPPSSCPPCGGHVSVLDIDPIEHLQEDIIDGRYRVVLFRHVAAKCPTCNSMVQKAGAGEILHSRIGPGLRSKAVYLRNVIGTSYRKIPQAIEEMFGIRFTPANSVCKNPSSLGSAMDDRSVFNALDRVHFRPRYPCNGAACLEEISNVV